MIDFIRLGDTSHSYTGGTGALSIDGDFNTDQSVYQSVGSPDGDVYAYATVISEHTFAQPRNIAEFRYRFYNAAGANGQSYLMYIQYQPYGGSYTDAYRSTTQQDTGNVTLAVSLNNIIAVKAYVYATGHSYINKGSGMPATAGAYIYEIQAWGNADYSRGILIV